MGKLTETGRIWTKPGVVNFPGYESLRAQAVEVARIIQEMDVSEESIKDAKKMLATANKSIKELEDARIGVKKDLLEPYQDLETKIKEIVGIVRDAESEARSKIRQLEEQERDQKEEELRSIWGLRHRPYEKSLAFLEFEDWLTPQHLNKTMSIKKAEEDMTQWLEAKSRDVLVIMGMEYGVDILSEYKSCLDLGLAVATVKQRALDREKIERVMPKAEHTAPVTVFIIEDPKDAALTEMLMKSNNVTYKKEIK